MPAANPDSALLKYEDVADLLGVSRRSVIRFVARKQLRIVNLGHSTKRFRRADVDSFLAKRAGDTASLRQW